MSLFRCTCGYWRKAEEMASHVLLEHLGDVVLPYECGVCQFTATSEDVFLAHCIKTEHDPNSDAKILVSVLVFGSVSI